MRCDADETLVTSKDFKVHTLHTLSRNRSGQQHRRHARELDASALRV